MPLNDTPALTMFDHFYAFFPFTTVVFFSKFLLNDYLSKLVRKFSVSPLLK